MKKEKSNNLLLIVVTILAVILFLNRGGRRERNDSLPAGAATSTPEVIAVPTAKPADPAAFPADKSHACDHGKELVGLHDAAGQRGC